jgi:PleD family two-component response regulator
MLFVYRLSTVRHPERLMHDADAAMFLAKASGRNRFYVYSNARQINRSLTQS